MPRAELESIARIEHHADARRERAGQAPPADRCRARGARPAAGSATSPCATPMPDVVDLVRSAGGIVVVDDHDALGDGHAPGRPRDQRLRVDERREVAEMQAVVEHADVAAGDRDGRALGDDRRHLLAVRGDDRSLVRRVRDVEAFIRLGESRRRAPRRARAPPRSAASSSSPARRSRPRSAGGPPRHLERVAQPEQVHLRAARRAGFAAGARPSAYSSSLPSTSRRRP